MVIELDTVIFQAIHMVYMHAKFFHEQIYGHFKPPDSNRVGVPIFSTRDVLDYVSLTTWPLWITHPWSWWKHWYPHETSISKYFGLISFSFFFFCPTFLVPSCTLPCSSFMVNFLVVNMLLCMASLYHIQNTLHLHMFYFLCSILPQLSMSPHFTCFRTMKTYTSWYPSPSILATTHCGWHIYPLLTWPNNYTYRRNIAPSR